MPARMWRGRRRVGYSITNPAARGVFERAVAIAQLTGTSLPDGVLIISGDIDNIDLLAYDGAPWTSDVRAAIERFRARHPRVPVLLYRPLGSRYARLAEPLTFQAGVVDRVQVPHAPGEAEDLGAIMTVLLRDVPRRVAEDLLRTFLDPLNPVVSQFAVVSISLLATKSNGTPTIRAVCDEMAITEHALRAAFPARQGPPSCGALAPRDPAPHRSRAGLCGRIL